MILKLENRLRLMAYSGTGPVGPDNAEPSNYDASFNPTPLTISDKRQMVLTGMR